ncbi:hypothetical protein ASZ90_004394 [hydrocarbon metagenome]|uniref:RCK C-terminal domain-containing protein n=1 Tax=hydrocarbon metagenome TaxID=938273 RepID=A0A0W8FXX5_9ZZZZ
MFRSIPKEVSPIPYLPLNFPELEICSFIINEDSIFADKSLSELDLRNKYGFSILAIKRNSDVIVNPTAATILKPGDLVFILTEHDKITDLSELFKK